MTGFTSSIGSLQTNSLICGGGIGKVSCAPEMRVGYGVTSKVWCADCAGNAEIGLGSWFARIINYAFQIACEMLDTDEKGVVSLDLKPEKIFITSEGSSKILIFCRQGWPTHLTG